MRRLPTALLIFIFTSCSPGGPHKVAGGLEGLENPNGPSVGYNSARPIFAKYCAGCHPSRHGPDWLDYAQASKEAKTGMLYFKVVNDRSMPPPTSPEGAQISEAERLTLGSWARSGAPLVAAQSVAPSSQQESGPGESAPKTVQGCLHCHGTSGPDGLAEPRIPVLVGQNEAYLQRELTRFKWRERIDPSNAMNDVAIDLLPEQIREAASYYASRPYKTKTNLPNIPSESRALFERGSTLAQRDCVSCHYNADYFNQPTDALVPALAGQSKVYLTNQLIYFRGDERSNPLMHQLALRLSNADIEALTFYFANTH